MPQYDTTTPWPTADIVYTAVMGVVMLAAILEWFLWLGAFLYCLLKVYQKAEKWSVNILAVIVGICFTLLRLIFFPIMIVTLPLPAAVTQYFPEEMVNFLQWFGFWAFAGLLTVPWLFCVYQLVTHQLGRTKRIKEVLDEHSAPKVVIVMPCFKEEPDVLVTAIDSVVDCDYPASCIHVFLSFDGDAQDILYKNTIAKLGVPETTISYPKSIDLTYKAARITVSRFPHGGKRKCQKSTFKLIDRIYNEYLKRNDNLFILFIDSDCILDRVCLQNFIYDMELSPGNSRDMLAMTGVITATTKKHSLITLLQDIEYVHGQLFERTVESGCGSVTCLPGALTMLRFSAFRRMAKYYFADKAEKYLDFFDYGKCHLGEDRWLTHLLMVGAKKRYQIQMCTSAFCKTEAVQTYSALVNQRRRWFLGFITNEVCMLTDWRIWKRYPILVFVRFMQNAIRTTALLFIILILAIATTSKRVTDLPVGFIGISLGLNWLTMMYFGVKLGRYKVWAYPIMFVLNPFFNWFYMVYGIFTAGERTWGGPRANAGAADLDETGEEETEHVVTGDELNVDLENFGAAPPAHELTHLQPPDRVDGRFAVPERLPGGWYDQENESLASVTVAGDPFQPRRILRYRHSNESFLSEQNSIFLPRRVESLVDDEDRRKHAMAEANQHVAGGAYMTSAIADPADQAGEISAAIQRAYSLNRSRSVAREGTIHDRRSNRPTTNDRSPSYGEAFLDGTLTVPKAVAASSSARTSGSPLARSSLARTASMVEPLPIELEESRTSQPEARYNNQL